MICIQNKKYCKNTLIFQENMKLSKYKIESDLFLNMFRARAKRREANCWNTTSGTFFYGKNSKFIFLIAKDKKRMCLEMRLHFLSRTVASIYFHLMKLIFALLKILCIIKFIFETGILHNIYIRLAPKKWRAFYIARQIHKNIIFLELYFSSQNTSFIKLNKFVHEIAIHFEENLKIVD